MLGQRTSCTGYYPRARRSAMHQPKLLWKQWRVSIQLFDGARQRITFSERHDFRMENVFEAQDEIGRRVVEALNSRFARVVPKSRDRYSSDPEAYADFMSGLRASYGDSPEE